MSDTAKKLAFVAFAVVLLFAVTKWPPSKPVVDQPPIVVPVTKVTAVVYVWEKDEAPMPSAVRDALDTLNRQGIIATEFEQNTKNGKGETPEQYKVPLAAAKIVGLPALIVMDGSKVIRTVKSPNSVAQVLEAAKP